MNTRLHGAKAAAIAAVALAGVAASASADEKPQKETANAERVIIRAGENASATGGSYSFSVQSDDGRAAADEIRKRVIGVTLSNISDALASQLKIDRDKCVIVSAVDPDGAAAKAGVRLHDLIIGVEDGDGCTIESLSKAINDVGDNGVVRLRLRRGGESETVKVQPRIVVLRRHKDKDDNDDVNRAFFREIAPAEKGQGQRSPDGAKWYSQFSFSSDADGPKATYEIFGQRKQALEALKKLEDLLSDAKSNPDAQEAFRSLRKALESAGGFSVLPQVDFFARSKSDAKSDSKSEAKGSGGKSLYIPSIELDDLKVIVDDGDGDNVVKAITVGPKDGKTLTLHGLLSSDLDGLKALHLDGNQLKLGAGASFSLGDGAQFGVLKALEGVRAAASSDCDDDSVGDRLDDIDAQLDRIEKLLKRLLKAVD